MSLTKKCIFALTLLILVVSVSCSLFEDDEANLQTGIADEKTDVKFCIQKQKSLSMSYPSGSGEIYQYKATPVSEEGTPDSGTDWKVFENNKSAGEFAKGPWLFEFRILYGTLNSYGVIATGSKEVTVSGEQCTVTAVLQNVFTTTKTGNMDFSILVKALTGNEGTLEIYIDDNLAIIDNPDYEKEDSDIRITGSVSASAGFHTVRFKYFDYELEPNLPISSETMSIRFVENAHVNVSGTLASGVDAESTIYVVYPSISATVSHSQTTLTTGNEVTFTCNAETGITGTVALNYIWYVNGVREKESTEKTFKHTFSASGTYNISCVVWCMDGSVKIYGSDSEDVQVN